MLNLRRRSFALPGPIVARGLLPTTLVFGPTLLGPGMLGARAGFGVGLVLGDLDLELEPPHLASVYGRHRGLCRLRIRESHKSKSTRPIGFVIKDHSRRQGPVGLELGEKILISPTPRETASKHRDLIFHDETWCVSCTRNQSGYAQIESMHCIPSNGQVIESVQGMIPTPEGRHVHPAPGKSMVQAFLMHAGAHTCPVSPTGMQKMGPLSSQKRRPPGFLQGPKGSPGWGRTSPVELPEVSSPVVLVNASVVSPSVEIGSEELELVAGVPEVVGSTEVPVLSFPLEEVSAMVSVAVSEYTGRQPRRREARRKVI